MTVCVSPKVMRLPIGQKLGPDQRVSVINERFFQQLGRWKWRARTLRGRRLLAQAVILSQLWYATAVTYVPNAIICSWQRVVDMYVLRSASSASEARRPIDSWWLYHNKNDHTLGIPHVHTILKRQRLKLLFQIVQDSASTSAFTWSFLARFHLDAICGPFGRPGRHDYLWVNPRSKIAREGIMLLPVWLRGIIRTSFGTNLAVEFDNLTPDERTLLHLEAPLWMNRFKEWHTAVRSDSSAKRCLLPAPSDQRFDLLCAITSSSKIFCLADVYIPSGWPSEAAFVQRVILDIAATIKTLPRRRTVVKIYDQLSRLNADLGSDTVMPWPWAIRPALSVKRFPTIPPKLLYHTLLPHSTSTSVHPFLRHNYSVLSN